tara:strand:- start:14686 stop:15408 length:723 start_codon:yes stop_codon:yes gene_type:complete
MGTIAGAVIAGAAVVGTAASIGTAAYTQISASNAADEAERLRNQGKAIANATGKEGYTAPPIGGSSPGGSGLLDQSTLPGAGIDLTDARETYKPNTPRHTPMTAEAAFSDPNVGFASTAFTDAPSGEGLMTSPSFEANATAPDALSDPLSSTNLAGAGDPFAGMGGGGAGAGSYVSAGLSAVGTALPAILAATQGGPEMRHAAPQLGGSNYNAPTMAPSQAGNLTSTLLSRYSNRRRGLL